MRRIVNLKIAVLFFVIALLGCEKLKPESVNVPDYPNLEEVLLQQVQFLDGKNLKKEVWLDGKNESKEFEMDTTFLKKELSFLNEINPNTPQYVGAFEIIEEENQTKLTLGVDEKGELKMLSYTKEGVNYTNIKAMIHEEKEVYSHHRDFDIYFKDGLLESYSISGYQKILLKDTIRFKIMGKLN